MDESVTIPRRFNGPPDSANGGYACGVVAGLVGDGAVATLRSPPPLDRPLRVARRVDGVDLFDGDTLVASGAHQSVEIDVPDPVAFADAERASLAYVGFRSHIFPTCFVCGPRRPAADGLGLFPGRVPGRDVVAAPWVPDASVCDAHGVVHPECVWASLDCPSYFGLATAERGTSVALLGRIGARIDRRPHLSERCVVVGWGIEEDGRKLHAGSALWSEERGLLASARSTWILLRPS